MLINEHARMFIQEHADVHYAVKKNLPPGLSIGRETHLESRPRRPYPTLTVSVMVLAFADL